MLILVRHGQTAGNAAGLLLGRADLALTDLGRLQADALAEALRHGVDRVVSSPLQRARQTADALGLPVEIDDRWVEVDYGEYDELPFNAVPAAVWQSWRTDETFRPPGGESFREVGERVRAACDELVEDAADRNVVVVSHVSPIKAAVAWALDVSGAVSWRMHLDVAAICRVSVSRRAVSLLTFNETAHLAAVPH